VLFFSLLSFYCFLFSLLIINFSSSFFYFFCWTREAERARAGLASRRRQHDWALWVRAALIRNPSCCEAVWARQCCWISVDWWWAEINAGLGSKMNGGAAVNW
jgi:hypothetical protein